MANNEHLFERRAFLGTAAAAAAAGIGCAGTRAGLGALSPMGEAEIRAELARVDAALARTGAIALATTVFRQAASEAGGETVTDSISTADARFLEEADAFARDAVGALTFAGLFGALSVDAQRHPEARAKLRSVEPMLDRAMAKAGYLLSNTSDAGYALVDSAIEATPGLIEDVLKGLDAGSRDVGLGIGGRMKLRRVGTHLAGRLRVQPAKTLADETMSKVGRMAHHHGLAQSVGVSVAHNALRDVFYSVGEQPPPVQRTLTDNRIARYERRTTAFMRTGAVLAGLGALVLVVSGAALAITSEIGPAFGLTAGAILASLALTFIIIAASRRGRARRMRRQLGG